MVRAMMGKKKVEFTERILQSGSWTVPKGCTKIEVFLVGGGGAGGSNSHASGGGGGGGQTVNTTLDVAPGQIYNVIIGKGGTNVLQAPGYVGTNGTNGGDTSFGDIVAKGGDGGKGTPGNHQPGSGGINYTKGGDGGRPSDRGLIIATPGVNGTLYDGDYYGSSGGAGGANGGRGMEQSMPGGINAGHGYAIHEYQKDKNYPLIKPNSGCGGGSSWANAFMDDDGKPILTSANGADGIVIIKGLRY